MARGGFFVCFRQDIYSAECCLVSAQGSHMLQKIRPGGWLICLCAPISWLHASNLFTHTLLPSFIPPQVRVDISAVCRGDLSVSLESPSGTVSLLLDKRPNDASTAGLTNWTLMSVHCWEEQPRGLWTLRVRATCLFIFPPNGKKNPHSNKVDGPNDLKYEESTLLLPHHWRVQVQFWLELWWMFSPCMQVVYGNSVRPSFIILGCYYILRAESYKSSSLLNPETWDIPGTGCRLQLRWNYFLITLPKRSIHEVSFGVIYMADLLAFLAFGSLDNLIQLPL